MTNRDDETPEEKRKREWREWEEDQEWERKKAGWIAGWRGTVPPPPLPPMSNT